jgi:S-adenosylmethionine decarboxylase proenzyme
MKRMILIVLSMALHAFPDDALHHFAGKHFLASYLDCDLQRIADLDGMLRAMDGAVQASGATVLNSTPYVFPPNGLTVVYLLSESHASLHTYPEHGACFVDLFTCGDHCSAEKFDAALRAYLKPKEVNARLFLRHEGIEEAPYSQAIHK